VKFVPVYPSYDGYNKLKSVTRCGCWAHVRRKFVDALPDKKDTLPDSAAVKGIEFCNRLFLLEREYDGFEAAYEEDGSASKWTKVRDPLDSGKEENSVENAQSPS